jgi:O-methyltransferase involved in polyketide biosynthesis
VVSSTVRTIKTPRGLPFSEREPQVLSQEKCMATTRLRPELNGVPETMLWSLYERVTEAKRQDGMLPDPEAIRIYESIEFDFAGKFGSSSRLAAARAARIDSAVRDWLRRHPRGIVASLGEGLETQAYRVDNGTMRWLSVDLPEAMTLREHFLKPTDRFKHLAMSALDPRWMDAVDDRSGVLIIAQGLLMYFEPEEVRRLMLAIKQRLRQTEMIFDLIPRITSQSTIDRVGITPNFTPPVMPWGLDRNEVEATLRSWLPDLKGVRCARYNVPGTKPGFIESLLDIIHPGRQRQPSLVQLAF